GGRPVPGRRQRTLWTWPNPTGRPGERGPNLQLAKGGAFAPERSLWGAIAARSWSGQIPIRKQEAAAQSPKLVAGDGDGHDDHHDREVAVHAAATIRYFQEIAEPAFRVGPNLGENEPGPAHAVGAAQVVPDVCLGHGKQDVAHQLPLA